MSVLALHSILTLTLVRVSFALFCLTRYDAVDSSSTTIEDLEPGAAYEILILAVRDGQEEQVGSRLVLTTRSVNENIIEGLLPLYLLLLFSHVH